MLKKSLSGMVSPLRWNLKRLPGSDFVRIAEHVAISIENLHIFADIYSPALRYSSFADLGEAIPRLYCVRALMASEYCGLRPSLPNEASARLWYSRLPCD